jgi:hypothetical protein
MIVRLKSNIDTAADTYADSCTPGKPYYVYATIKTVGESDPKFMINVWGMDSNDTIYSIPSRYFEIIDNTIPEDWEVGTYEAYGKGIEINSFPEISKDKYFYEKLLDDNPDAIQVFRRYADKYEQEARDFQLPRPGS